MYPENESLTLNTNPTPLLCRRTNCGAVDAPGGLFMAAVLDPEEPLIIATVYNAHVSIYLSKLCS